MAEGVRGTGEPGLHAIFSSGRRVTTSCPALLVGSSASAAARRRSVLATAAEGMPFSITYMGLSLLAPCLRFGRHSEQYKRLEKMQALTRHSTAMTMPAMMPPLLTCSPALGSLPGRSARSKSEDSVARPRSKSGELTPDSDRREESAVMNAGSLLMMTTSSEACSCIELVARRTAMFTSMPSAIVVT